MRNIEKEQEEIDLSKALAFVFITLIITLLIASYMIIPDIQQLKISKINANRSLTILKSTREYHDKLSEENKQLQEKNRKTIESLETALKENRFYKFAEEKLGNFKMNSKKITSYDNNFIKNEINASTNINTIELFYSYIDSLDNYESMSEITFPISIVSKDDYSLDVQFNIGIYELSSK